MERSRELEKAAPCEVLTAAGKRCVCWWCHRSRSDSFKWDSFNLSAEPGWPEFPFVSGLYANHLLDVAHCLLYWHGGDIGLVINSATRQGHLSPIILNCSCKPKLCSRRNAFFSESEHWHQFIMELLSSLQPPTVEEHEWTCQSTHGAKQTINLQWNSSVLGANQMGFVQISV